MANILEFLRGVLTDGDAQGAFLADPPGYLEQAGFADLTGEDVVEAVGVLRRSLPAEASTALAPFDDEDELPAVRPGHEERELDAAARLLVFAVDQVPAAAAPADRETEVELAGDEELEYADEELEVDARAEEAEVEHEPIAVESELAEATAAGGSQPVAPVAIDVTALPSVAAFAESLAAAASDTRARYDDALRRFTAEAEAHAQEVADRYGELLRLAERDANQIRAAAEAEVAGLRAAVEADRTAANQELERSRAEADAILQRARDQAEAVRRQSDEMLAHARADAEATRRDIDERKAEMRDAERQLKERLTGIDSLFRTVLRDEDSDPTTAG